MLHGKTVLEHVLAAVKAADLPCHVVHPAGAQTAGMGDSIAAGVRHCADAAGWLILPADMPLIRPSTLMAVAQALRQVAGQEAVVLPCYAGQTGHPVAFTAACREALLHVKGEQGARNIVQRLRQQGCVVELEVDDAGILCDIDTIEDLKKAATLLEN